MARVLVFSSCRRGHGRFSYHLDWFEALYSHPGFDVDVVDTSTHAALVYGLLRARRRAYDLVVYPYGFFYENGSNRRRAIFALGGHVKGVKVFFLENEYRLLREKLAYAVSLGADYVTTQLPKDVADRVYGALFPSSRIIPLPHALRPAGGGAAGAGEGGRDIDIGFRGSSFPYYMGHRDRESIMRFFAENGPRLGLRVDITEDAGLSRPAWQRFLRR